MVADKLRYQRVELVIFAVLAISSVYVSIFFAVGFPYSINITGTVVFLVFIHSIWFFQYSLYHLFIPLVFTCACFFQVFLLVDEVNVSGLSFNQTSTPTFSFLKTKIDVSLALESYRFYLLYFIVFLLTFVLASVKSIKLALYTTVVFIGLISIALGLAAPRNNSKILWHYSIPKIEQHKNLRHNYVSPVAHRLISSMNGYMWEYKLENISLKLDQKQISTRPVGGIVNENQYACILGISLPLVVGFFFLNKAKSSLLFKTVAFLCAMLALYLMLIVSHARGSVLALGVSIGLVFLFKKKTNFFLIFINLVIAIVAISILISIIHNDWMISVLSGRPVAWKETLALFMKNKIAGIGLGNFTAYRVIINPAYNSICYASHNNYLQLIAEIGVVGIGLAFILIWLFFKGVTKKEKVVNSPMTLSLFLSCLFIIIYSALDYSVSMPFNAIIASIVIGLFLSEFFCSKQPECTTRRSVLFVKIALTCIVSISIYQFSVFNSAEVQLQKLKRAVGESLILGVYGQDDSMSNVLKMSIKSFNEFPYNAEYARQIGFGFLTLSGAVNINQLSLAADWLTLSQNLAVDDRYTAMTIKEIKSKLQ